MTCSLDYGGATCEGRGSKSNGTEGQLSLFHHLPLQAPPTHTGVCYPQWWVTWGCLCWCCKSFVRDLLNALWRHIQNKIIWVSKKMYVSHRYINCEKILLSNMSRLRYQLPTCYYELLFWKSTNPKVKVWFRVRVRDTIKVSDRVRVKVSQ